MGRAVHFAESVMWGFLGTILQVSSQKAVLQQYLQITVDSP